MMLQTPPAMPPIPFDPNSPALMMMVIAFFAMVGLVFWPLARAIARRLEGKHAADPALRLEVEQLQQRLGDLETLQHRVGELEERIDFAERLLARADPSTVQLPRGGS